MSKNNARSPRQILKPSYFIANIIQPLLLESILIALWHRGDLAYYLCDLYEDKSRQSELYIVLYNLLTKDGAIIPYTHPRVYGVLKRKNLDVLPLVVKTSPFAFEKHCVHSIYANHNMLRFIAATIYSLIHSVRNSTLTRSLRLACFMTNYINDIRVNAIIIGPVNEEIVFRWFFQRTIQESLKRFIPVQYYKHADKVVIPFSIFVQAIYFAAAHSNWQKADLSRFLGGISLGIQYERTGNLLVPIAMHMLWNGMVWLMRGNEAQDLGSSKRDILDPAQYIDDGIEKILATIWRPVLLIFISMCIQYSLKMSIVGRLFDSALEKSKVLKPIQRQISFFKSILKSTSKGGLKGLAISTIPASIILLTTHILYSDEGVNSLTAVFNVLLVSLCLLSGAAIGAISGLAFGCFDVYRTSREVVPQQQHSEIDKAIAKRKKNRINELDFSMKPKKSQSRFFSTANGMTVSEKRLGDEEMTAWFKKFRQR